MSSINSVQPTASFSIRRVAIVLLPVFIAAVSFLAYKYRADESDAQAKGERMLLGTLGLGKTTKNRLNERFQDADADLVADGRPIPRKSSRQTPSISPTSAAKIRIGNTLCGKSSLRRWPQTLARRSSI